MTSPLATRFLVCASVALLWGASGAHAGPFLFTAADTPKPLPDLSTTISTITVPGGSGFTTINDINVTVDLNHTFVGDLRIFVDHVDTGTSVQLFSNFGGSGVNIRDVTFDDEAAFAINSVGAPYGPGSFRPVPGLLSAFDGESLMGSWNLRIIDDNQFDSGTLNNFAISGDANTVQSAVPEPASAVLFLMAASAVTACRLRRSHRKKMSSPAIV